MRSAGSVYARAECEIPDSPELATLRLWHSDSIGPVPASTHGCPAQKHSPGYPSRRHEKDSSHPPRRNTAPVTRHEGTKKTPRTLRAETQPRLPGTKKTPRAPVRARLPLLRFRPGGIGLDGATRGAAASLPGWHRSVERINRRGGIDVRQQDAVESPSTSSTNSNTITFASQVKARCAAAAPGCRRDRAGSRPRPRRPSRGGRP